MAYKKVEFTEEEKALFLMNNTKLNFWVDKELFTEFNKVCKSKDKKLSEVLIKYMTKVVEKHNG